MTTESHKRNVVLVGCHGAGKTSFVEAALFNCKILHNIHVPKHGEPVFLDKDPEEQKRQMSIQSQVYTMEWKKNQITFIDTPGYNNFLVDTQNSILAADGAVLVVNPVRETREPSFRYWEMIDKAELPRLIFVNRMDKEKANFDETIMDLQQDLDINPVCVEIPIGAEDTFSGVVNLIKMKASVSKDGSDKTQETDIPAELQKAAQDMRVRYCRTGQSRSGAQGLSRFSAPVPPSP